jgi:hypothetical protein
MSSNSINAKARELMSDTHVTVHVKTIFDWRFRLGLRLMKIGAHLMGFCTVVVTSDEWEEGTR